VKRIKGNNRPINTVDDRVEVLSALAFIDYIIIFDEDTPYKLIEKIKPDILVKGGDYKPENIVGADIVKQYNGEVIALPFLKGKSSTKIIEKASLEP
jgi:D-beta-D-heptose 7-phosphate kinase/D-beta-D-heptose 1-phosphate adenosyltransferase